MCYDENQGNEDNGSNSGSQTRMNSPSQSVGSGSGAGGNATFGTCVGGDRLEDFSTPGLAAFLPSAIELLLVMLEACNGG